MHARIAALLALTALAAGCGGGSGASSSPGPTRLVITVFPGFVANAHVTRYTLTCRPAGGSVTDPAAACAALEAAPSLLRSPAGCTVAIADAGSERVTGTLDGRPVRLTLPGGCRRWTALRAALGLGAATGG
jgi:Subtilisin inhibitor-like